MKTINILILSLAFLNVFAQDIPEKQIETKVNEVTVFLKGAQVMRKKSVNLTSGKTQLKFVNLSPFIDAKSVQIKARGNITVLSVSHQLNYLDLVEKSDELTSLQNKLKLLEHKITLENTYLEIIREELAFLNVNRNISGKNDQLSASNLQQASEFYGNKLTALKLKEIERNQTLVSLHEEKRTIEQQMSTLTNKKDFPTGEIIVKVDAKQSASFTLELSYMVQNAGWYPSYDIRAKNLNEPVQITYKANVKQDTKVDWSNVKLTFSSADPNISGVAPKLQTYFLNYYSAPINYNMSHNSVHGKVMDSEGMPLPGVNVVVEGTTIGTVTDMDGNYSLTLPAGQNRLSYSYIGYENIVMAVNNSTMNVHLQEDLISLDEVVVVGYGSTRKRLSSALTGAISGVKTEREKQSSAGGLAVPSAQVQKQTTVNFEIETPYTIKSDNRNYTVEMENYSLPAFYQYYCVPKIDRDAFLIAHISNWEQYNLLDGEANIFFEDTYIGKTLLDLRHAADTLEISLGRDKQISVQREKVKDFTTKQFIGSKKEETRAWETTVKNNKSQEVNIIILDQVPVSTLEEIEVDVQNISGAKHTTATGELEWELKLKPGDTKELNMKYSVKYPKNRNLVVE